MRGRQWHWWPSHALCGMAGRCCFAEPNLALAPAKARAPLVGASGSASPCLFSVLFPSESHRLGVAGPHRARRRRRVTWWWRWSGWGRGAPWTAAFTRSLGDLWPRLRVDFCPGLLFSYGRERRGVFSAKFYTSRACSAACLSEDSVTGLVVLCPPGRRWEWLTPGRFGGRGGGISGMPTTRLFLFVCCPSFTFFVFIFSFEPSSVVFVILLVCAIKRAENTMDGSKKNPVIIIHHIHMPLLFYAFWVPETTPPLSRLAMHLLHYQFSKFACFHLAAPLSTSTILVAPGHLIKFKTDGSTTHSPLLFPHARPSLRRQCVCMFICKQAMNMSIFKLNIRERRYYIV